MLLVNQDQVLVALPAGLGKHSDDADFEAASTIVPWSPGDVADICNCFVSAVADAQPAAMKATAAATAVVYRPFLKFSSST